MNIFKIKNKECKIEHAYLDAYTDDDELIFGLNIRASSDIFNNTEDLSLFSETILKIKPNEIEKWEDLVGKKIECKEFIDDEEPHAFLCVFEQEAIYNATIEFKKEEEKIILHIKGSCDIRYNDEFNTNLPLEIKTEIDFYGLYCGDSTEEEIKKKVGKFLDFNELKVMKNKNDISIVIPKNTDMNKNKIVLGE